MTEQQPPRPEAAPTAESLPVDWSTEPTPAFVTGAHVIHSLRAFSVLFDEAAAFPGRLGTGRGGADARARIVASLRIPPDTFFQILCAMTSSWNRFALQYLDRAAPRPRFRLFDSGDVQLDGVDNAPRTGTR